MPDILLRPTNPISSSFHVEGLTCDGWCFVRLYCSRGIIRGEGAMVGLKFLARGLGLSIKTDWTCAGKAMAS